jgi:plastocyanin
MLSLRAMAAVFAACVLNSCGSSGGTEPTPNPGGGPGPGGGPSGVTVNVINNDYTPDPVSVARGTTVTWRWDSCTDDGYGSQTCAFHSVTFDDGGPSAAAQNGGTFARTFAGAGTFTYYCTSHGRTVMSGSVVVQ